MMIKNISQNLCIAFFLTGGILIPSLTIAAGEVMPNIPTEEINKLIPKEESTLSRDTNNARSKAKELLKTKGIGDVTKDRMDEKFKQAESLLTQANNMSYDNLAEKNDLYREALRTYTALSRDLTTLAQHRRIPPVRSGGILPGPGRDYSGGDYIKKKFIPKFINATITLLFSVSIIILIISGIMYMIGSGDQDAIKKAKDMSLWAIAGTILAIFSFAIVKFIIGINFGG